MTKVYVDLEQAWVFEPTYDQGGDTYRERQFAEHLAKGDVIELDPEFLERYKKASEEFWTMNGELEELYRKHFMK